MRRPWRVVIVEDDFAVAKLHTRFVQAHDAFTVSGVVGSGGAALQHIRAEPPDVLLLDFYLPDISGLDLLSMLRSESQLADIAVVAVTAARDLDSIRRAHSGGVVHYLVKPFKSAELHARLDDVAARLERLRSSGQELAQAEIDSIIGGSPISHPQLPKGLGEPTMEVIVAALRSFATDASAHEVARAAGLSRVTARRYLEHLRTTGQARVSVRYGRTGRPEHRYAAVRTEPVRPAAPDAAPEASPR